MGETSTAAQRTDDRTPPVPGPGLDFLALVESTSKRLFRLAARICGDLVDAQDILQESYLRAYRASEERGFQPHAAPETWLYGIVTHVALNWVRDRTRSNLREQTWPTREHDGVATAEARVALRELSQLLDGLPSEQRVVVVLKEIEGLSAKEVASILNISDGAVEQRLVRARETLRTRVRHG